MIQNTKWTIYGHTLLVRNSVLLINTFILQSYYHTSTLATASMANCAGKIFDGCTQLGKIVSKFRYILLDNIYELFKSVII